MNVDFFFLVCLVSLTQCSLSFVVRAAQEHGSPGAAREEQLGISGRGGGRERAGFGQKQKWSRNMDRAWVALLGSWVWIHTPTAAAWYGRSLSVPSW